jgi:tankyrase
MERQIWPLEFARRAQLGSGLYHNASAEVRVNAQLHQAESMTNELFDICCECNPRPKDQRRRIAMALKKGADIHAADKNGVTALHHAVRFRSPSAVKTLIEHGANVNQACRRNGSTPLHRAVTQTGAPGTAGKGAAAKEIIAILRAAGADPSIANKSGKRPADYVTDDATKALFENQ